AADVPSLVRGGNDRGDQRSAHRRHCRQENAVSNAARFLVPGAVEAPREHLSSKERNRATHRIEDLVDRLRLVRSPGNGPVTYRQLIARFGSASAALDAVPDLARRGGGSAPKLFARDQAEREIDAGEKLGARSLVLGQGLYPRLLAEQEDAPPLLIVKGDLGLL